jgi:cytochrome P450
VTELDQRASVAAAGLDPAKLQGRNAPSMTILPTGSFLFKNLGRIYRYPDMVHVKLGINDFYLVTNPALIQEVLVTKQRDFAKGVFLQNTKRVFGDGLLTSEGDFHHRQRRLVQPAFHHDRIKAYAATMIEHEERLTGRWHDGDVLDVHGEMTKLTMAIIAKCLFDREIESEAKTISDDLTTTIEYFNRLSSPLAGILERLPSSKKYHEATERVDGLVYTLIKERRASSPHDAGDLMSMLLRAKDEDGSVMTDTQVRDEVLITFAAGHETTANALTWTWYLLSQNPAVEEKLQAEVDAVTGSHTPSPEDVPRLEYTTKVLTESMRIYPPAWILVRQAMKDSVIGGYLIPRGAGLALSQYVTQHDPKLFPEPERFDPDRWTPETRDSLPKFAYFPFGGGARGCIGEPFAWMEGVLLLAAISRRWSMRHVEGHRVEMLPRITLRPKYGMKMRLRRR